MNRIWQSFRSHSDLPLIVMWSTSASSPRKYQLIDGQICTSLKTHFVAKYLVDDQALFHGLRHSEYQKCLTCEMDHLLNVMPGLYCVLNNILTIYVKLHAKLYISWAEAWYSSSLITHTSRMTSRFNFRTQLVKLWLMSWLLTTCKYYWLLKMIVICGKGINTSYYSAWC